MFGSLRRKASIAATEALRPVVSGFQQRYGLPAGFWADEYVLGFMVTTAAYHAQLATAGKINGATLGEVMADAITSVSHLDGLRIVSRLGALEEHPDFSAGADVAMIVCLYASGNLKNEATNELVARATRVAERMNAEMGVTSPAQKRASTAAVMMILGFVEPVRRRFGIGDGT